MAAYERIGPYELIEDIAVGGMATVHLARERTATGATLVALKRMRADLAREGSVVRLFHAEAQLGVRLVHPNVCRVLAGGSHAGIPFITMEWLVGETADALLGSERWRRERTASHAVRIVMDAAAGLHAAHELLDADGVSLGTVHADVCPQNVMVTYAGEVKVIDFGIAQFAGSRPAAALRGRVAYMAPEQIEQHAFDRRADVWALGVMLWELLTGERLFVRNGDPATMYAVMEAPIAPPSQVRLDLSPVLDDIVMRALQRRPDHRYATARDLAIALAPFASASRTLGGWMQGAFAEQFASKRAQVARVSMR